MSNISDELKGDYALMCSRMAAKAKDELERSGDVQGSALTGAGPLPSSALATRSTQQREAEAAATREKMERWLARREVALERLFLVTNSDSRDAEFWNNENAQRYKAAAVAKGLLVHRD